MTACVASTNDAEGEAAKRSFTSWKLTLIDALISDPRVTDGQFRIAFRVMQGVNSESRVGLLSDALLCDEVPKTDRFRLNDCRKKLEALGWWQVDRGHGGKASRYSFSDSNVNAVLDQRELDREARSVERARRQSEDRRRKTSAISVVEQPPKLPAHDAGDVVPLPHKSAASDAWDVVEEPHNSQGDVVEEPHKPFGGRGNPTTGDVVDLPPVHLQTPSEDSALEEEGVVGDYPHAQAREAACRVIRRWSDQENTLPIPEGEVHAEQIMAVAVAQVLSLVASPTERPMDEFRRLKPHLRLLLLDHLQTGHLTLDMLAETMVQHGARQRAAAA